MGDAVYVRSDEKMPFGREAGEEKGFAEGCRMSMEVMTHLLWMEYSNRNPDANQNNITYKASIEALKKEFPFLDWKEMERE